MTPLQKTGFAICLVGTTALLIGAVAMVMFYDEPSTDVTYQGPIRDWIEDRRNGDETEDRERIFDPEKREERKEERIERREARRGKIVRFVLIAGVIVLVVFVIYKKASK